LNYQRIYNEIIINRKLNKILEGYTEKHHIIPRSLGGTDAKDNLVILSAREHFICHLLLTKIYNEGTIEWIKMIKAFHMMMYYLSDTQHRYINSHFYDYLKIKYVKAQTLNQSGKNNSQYGKKWIIHSETQKIKKIYQTELAQYLNQGWQLGRKLNPYKPAFVRNSTIDKLQITEEEKLNLKKQNREKRKQVFLQHKLKTEKTYIFINKITRKHKKVSLSQISSLTEEWESLFYTLDTEKENIKQMLLNNITIQEIANFYNLRYNQFYDWYRKNGKDLRQMYKDYKNTTKKQVCPLCGKTFISKDKRVYCSNKCYKTFLSQRIWVSNGIKKTQIQPNQLSEWLTKGWYQIKPMNASKGKHGGWTWVRI